MADPRKARRTFAPVVLLGLASAGLAAVAGSKPWVKEGGADMVGEVVRGGSGQATAPLSVGLALVVLACWGVVLVTRGRFRVAVAILAVVAALGNAAAVALAPSGLADRLREDFRVQAGVTSVDTTLTAWFWIAVVAAVLVTASTALGVVLVRHWPEMGTKYDAPTAARSGEQPEDATVPTENIDIWKALDEGRDPTA